MMKRIYKMLLAATMCATIVVGGNTAVALASGINPNCPHNNYILEDSGGWYEDYSDNKHIYHFWEEIYCMDCGDYVTLTDDTPQDHCYNSDGVCDDCGHRE